MEINPKVDPRQLIALCRLGRLYEIEKWITAGRSLDISGAKKRGRQTTLLEVAVETHFHSMVELIAKHETRAQAKTDALEAAIASKRLDLVELLLAHGADIKSVPFADVLLTWNPKLIRFFLDRGADVLTDRPFAEAFRARVRTALRPFVEYKRAHPEIAAELQEQLDCALRHFCSEGDLKWVSLLMWAGADPRSKGPALEKECTNDPECYTSGLEQASYSENVDVLKRLKPDPARDNLGELLDHAAFLCRKPIIEYLLELGAPVNDRPNGGSAALDNVLNHLSISGYDAWGSKRLKSKYQLSRELDCIQLLLERGAIWNPDESYGMTSARRSLLECEPAVTIELLQMFRKHNACPAERVHKLLGTPRMRTHLEPVKNSLLRLGIHLDGPPKRRRQA